MERERIERLGSVRDKLVPLHRLKADLTDRVQGETPTPGGPPHRRNAIGSETPL